MFDREMWVGIADPNLKEDLHAALNDYRLQSRWVGVEQETGPYHVVVNVGDDPANPDDTSSVEAIQAQVRAAVTSFETDHAGASIAWADRREFLPPDVR